MARGGGNKKKFQYCTDPSEETLYLRALQGHSGRNLIEPSLQDNVLIPNDFPSTSITSDVQSIYAPSQIQDWGGYNFVEKTDGILYVCGSSEQGTQRSE